MCTYIHTCTYKYRHIERYAFIYIHTHSYSVYSQIYTHCNLENVSLIRLYTQKLYTTFFFLSRLPYLKIKFAFSEKRKLKLW